MTGDPVDEQIPLDADLVRTDRILTVPNVITVVRLSLLPVFVWLLFGKEDRAAAAYLLAVIGTTDFFDGYIARHFNQVSELGKVLDPVADRLLFFVGGGCILIDGSIPTWFAVAVLVREVLISLATLGLAAAGARRIDVTWFGKAGAFALMMSIPFFLGSHGDIGWEDLSEDLAWVTGLPGLALYWYSLLLYVPMGLRALREGRADRAAAAGEAVGVKAVIMAGGEGTRLRPLTSNVPKPMMPLVNEPMMEHIVRLLQRHGFDEIVVTVAFLANHIRSYFGDGSDFGVRMVYATEETPLGTAGSVRNAMDELDERFLVISGDVLTDIDLGAIVKAHDDRKALATIGLVRVDDPLEFGIVITRDDGSIERFLEKPSWGQVFSDTINSGIFVLEPEIFDHIAADRPVDFSSEVFPALLEAGLPLYGSIAEGYWEDVGTLEAYLGAHKDILDDRVEVSVPGFEVGDGVHIGEGAEIHPDATVVGPAVIGENCRIEAGVRLGPYTVLGTNVRLRAGADLERVVVHDNSYLGEGVRLRGTTVGRSCDLRSGVRCDEGVVLGDECFVGEHAFLASGVKVYPFKTVEAGAVINSSIVWESRGQRSLFGRVGVSGLANVDVTPELATRLAMAYGTTLKKDTTVVTSRDSSRSARMLKRAMMAGLNAAGVNVLDLEVASVPVTRHAIRRPDVAGGLTIRLVEGDPQSCVIRFFDTEGSDLSEDGQRKIERLFGREDFRRVFPAEIGDIGFPPRALELYTTALEATVDIAAIQAARFKVVVDYSFGSTSFLMPNVLSKLGADVLGVNPYASTGRLLAFDKAAHALEVGALVKASGAHLGAVLDPDGEHLTLIDDTGFVVPDEQALLALLDLVSTRLLGDTVALPVNVTQHAEALLEPRGVSVRRTKLATSALMDAAGEPGVGFAGSTDGGFILPGFLPAFDAAASLVKVLELLAHSEQRLSEVLDGLPRPRIARETVVTPWEQKGMVMRSLVEMSKDREVDLIDGVRVHHDGGWALALPDPEDPVTHVWAEGATEADAKALAKEYARRIRQLLR